MTPEPIPQPVYQPTWRKPAGTLLILALIALWVGLVVQASGWVERWPSLVQGVFYCVAGIAWLWVLPLRRLLFWMEHGRWRRA